jgi:hypothetical protein
MSSQEKRFVRVAEGVYRYRTGGFYARGSINGKPTWQKLKATDLKTAKREAGDTMRSLERLDKEALRKTLANFADAALKASRGIAPAGIQEQGTRRLASLKTAGQMARIFRSAR